ncbi:hypothetical protein ACFYU8_18485 [Brevibacillus sp. NPDC003359]|uniref:hypothetical protein n=1 Tax=unclassified Brevibacillus TaxID=2684853 RepID=UPI00369AC9E8
MKRYILPVLLILFIYNSDLIRKIGAITGATGFMNAFGWLKGDEFDPIRVTVFIVLLPVVLVIPYIGVEILRIIFMKYRPRR